MSEIVLSDDRDEWDDEQPRSRLVAVPIDGGEQVAIRVQLRSEGEWRTGNSGMFLTWPEIRRLAAMDPESPMPRVRVIWGRITAYPEWHSDANGETMLVVSDDAMAEMDAALDPGTEGGDE